MAVATNSKVLIPESVSGTGKGVYSVEGFVLGGTNVKGSFDAGGLLKVAGNQIIRVEEWKANQASGILKDWFDPTQAYFKRLHWSDILALLTLVPLKAINPYTQLPDYHAGAGRVWIDDLTVRMLIKEIYDSGGAKDWNSIIKRKYPVVVDDLSQPDSPFNPESAIYDPKKPVFAYDPDNGYVIYASGEILWNETGGHYYDAANGIVVNYDKMAGTVTFASGAVLNLKTLEMLTTNKETVIIKNSLPWYQEIFRKVLADTKTQIIVIGCLVLIIYFKKRRENEG